MSPAGETWQFSHPPYTYGGTTLSFVLVDFPTEPPEDASIDIYEVEVGISESRGTSRRVINHSFKIGSFKLTARTPRGGGAAAGRRLFHSLYRVGPFEYDPAVRGTLTHLQATVVLKVGRGGNQDKIFEEKINIPKRALWQMETSVDIALGVGGLDPSAVYSRDLKLFPRAPWTDSTRILFENKEVLDTSNAANPQWRPPKITDEKKLHKQLVLADAKTGTGTRPVRRLFYIHKGRAFRLPDDSFQVGPYLNTDHYVQIKNFDAEKVNLNMPEARFTPQFRWRFAVIPGNGRCSDYQTDAGKPPIIAFSKLKFVDATDLKAEGTVRLALPCFRFPTMVEHLQHLITSYDNKERRHLRHDSGLLEGALGTLESVRLLAEEWEDRRREQIHYLNKAYNDPKELANAAEFDWDTIRKYVLPEQPALDKIKEALETVARDARSKLLVAARDLFEFLESDGYEAARDEWLLLGLNLKYEGWLGEGYFDTETAAHAMLMHSPISDKWTERAEAMLDDTTVTAGSVNAWRKAYSFFVQAHYKIAEGPLKHYGRIIVGKSGLQVHAANRRLEKSLRALHKRGMIKDVDGLLGKVRNWRQEMKRYIRDPKGKPPNLDKLVHDHTTRTSPPRVRAFITIGFRAVIVAFVFAEEHQTIRDKMKAGVYLAESAADVGKLLPTALKTSGKFSSGLTKASRCLGTLANVVKVGVIIWEVADIAGQYTATDDKNTNRKMMLGMTATGKAVYAAGTLILIFAATNPVGWALTLAGFAIEEAAALFDDSIKSSAYKEVNRIFVHIEKISGRARHPAAKKALADISKHFKNNLKRPITSEKAHSRYRPDMTVKKHCDSYFKSGLGGCVGFLRDHH